MREEVDRKGESLHTVIIGAGFAGLRAARVLGSKGQDVTLIDRRSYHLFTPLLYQVAAGTLAPSQIAVPIRALFRGEDNVRCMMAEVRRVDLEHRRVLLDDGNHVAYDRLVVAAGAQSHFFGKEDEWKDHVFSLDDVDSATDLRDRFLQNCERAERSTSPTERRDLLTVAIVGAGPSGVELAGSLADLANRTLAAEYEKMRPGDVRVVLYEGQERVLPMFSEEMSRAAHEQLEELGVEIHLGTFVEKVQDEGLVVGGEAVRAGLVCWGSGVGPAHVAQELPTFAAKKGIEVEGDCSLRGHPEVFAVGDISHHLDETGQPLPGLAPVALQQGSFVAKTILRDSRGLPRNEFQYRDKGLMATIGRARAVLEAGPLRLSGLVAWLGWVVLHLYYLVGFRNRALVLAEWIWSYVGARRGNRIIVSEQVRPAPHS